MASEDYYGGYDGGQSGGYAGSRGPASRKDDDKRKIFVGGLSWETTQAEMEAYFSKFGEVIDCTLKEDPNTRKSRGFGFVLFGDVSTVDKVIGQETHTLNGRTISPQRVRAKGQSSERTKKVFVGGVDPELSETDIRSYFSEFGPIEDVHLPYDKMKQSRRGFVFITFESEDTVEKVVEQPRQVLGGKEVDVKKATPKESRGGAGGGYGGGYGGGGYGGYSGGGGGGYGGYGGYDQGYGDSGWGRYGQGGGGSGGYSGSGYGSSGGGGGGGNYGGGWGGQDNYGNYSSGGGSGNDYYNQGGYGGY